MTESLVAELPEDVAREDEARQAAMASYYDFLRSADLSDAGDLLAYFGLDFFHDAAVEDLTINNDAETVTSRPLTDIEQAYRADCESVRLK